jgi:dCMP deaminase
MTWTNYFVGISEQVKLKSKDRSFQCGAVIVGAEREIVSTGYNSFPRGVDDSIEERYEKPLKYMWTEHAERNAIYNSARIGVSTKGCDMYITADGPCVDCARAIIQAGIKTLYCKREKILNQDTWGESVAVALQLLKEGGVEVKYYNTPDVVYTR